MTSDGKLPRNAVPIGLQANAGKGRPKGASNRITRDVKAMILMSLDKAGGVDYLVRQSNENPAAFMTLLGKILPMQLTGADGKDLPAPQFIIQPVQPAGEV